MDQQAVMMAVVAMVESIQEPVVVMVVCVRWAHQRPALNRAKVYYIEGTEGTHPLLTAIASCTLLRTFHRQ
jgi:hypothetical protein